MPRVFKQLVLTIALAALIAAGLALWASRDPGYTLQSWLAGSRYSSYDALIADAAKKHGIDPLLLKAIVWRESAFQPQKTGASGERGLMQVGEAAARDWARSGKIETFVPTDLFAPKTNLEVGAWYLKKALDRWKAKDDPVPFALAEYNAGRRRVDRWLGEPAAGEKAGAAELMRAIDFPSTRKYIEDISARREFYKAGK